MLSSIRFRGLGWQDGPKLYGWGEAALINADFDVKTSPVFLGTGWATLPTHAAFNAWAIRTSSRLYFSGINFNAAQSSLTLFSPAATQSWSQIISGASFILAIRSDGRLFSHGYNDYGTLGIGNTTNNLSTMSAVTTSSWLMAAASDYHALAIRADGALFSWGYNWFGGLGNGTATDTTVTTPTRVGTATWSYVDAGAYGTLAIRSDGKLFGWGEEVPGLSNTNGVVTQIGTDNWKAVSFSKNRSEFDGVPHVLAIRSDDKLFAWGGGQYGKLGTGGTTNQAAPVQIGSDNWASVSAGINFSLGIKSNGNLFAWGRNNYGQLGVGDTTNRTSPTAVGTKTWTKVAAILDGAGLAIES